MTNIAILAEKPSQAKAYADAFSVKSRHKTHIELNPCSTFPNGATITWGIGHLVELKEPKEYRKEWASWSLESLPILPAKYEYKVSYDKRVQFNFIKRLFNEPTVNTILNACDCDREGSNIFYSISYMTGAKNKTIKRLWINSLEVEEVRKGFKNLQDNKKDLLLYYEAKTRQISDWLVGMNGSRLYTLLLQQKGFNESLSIVRVQSPTVYLIYQRQKEIENFVSTPFYEIEGNFTAKNGTYKGKAKIKSDKKEEVLQLLQQHNIMEHNEGFVKSVTKKEKRTKSPKLHALSTLQAVANRRWRYSPANVLKIVQGLYEKKLVTYPRTDTQFITNNEFAYLADNVERYQQIAGISFPIVSPRCHHYMGDWASCRIKRTESL
ncbi:DNA topoisomerase [Sporosarcina sp. ITBMC105]